MRLERKLENILFLLQEAREPMTGRALSEAMAAYDADASERSVRLYLAQLEEQGLVERHGRRGCSLTEQGISVAKSAQVAQRVGFLSARIDQMTYRMSFDLPRRAGEVVVNTTFVKPADLADNLEQVCAVFDKGYAMGDRVGLLGPGESLGGMTVPESHVGLCTVCSITLNGVLLKHGIPTHSRFGGLLAVRNGKAERFVELIEYQGTSIDPLEVFIRSGMTDYHGAVRDGNGKIGASFREFPAESRDLVLTLSSRLAEIGLGALMEVGYPGRPLLDIPVSEGRVGAIVIGGLNPTAILEEKGIRLQARALSGLMEYSRLIHYKELPRRMG